ncbi:hypothetical protein KCA24_27450, partial [Escherichia coli]|nr:hypothetical protein [Escherichia coli]
MRCGPSNVFLPNGLFAQEPLFFFSQTEKESFTQVVGGVILFYNPKKKNSPDGKNHQSKKTYPREG